MGQKINDILSEAAQQAAVAEETTSSYLANNFGEQAELLFFNTFDRFYESQMTTDSSSSAQSAGQEQRATSFNKFSSR